MESPPRAGFFVARMPELPEVETSARGIAPYLLGQTVTGVVVRQRKLRWPVPTRLDREMPGQVIRSVRRRAKYILIETDAGTAMLHLGMSGHVTVLPEGTPAGVHDHVDINLSSGEALRLRDPRRFGSLLWTRDPETHKLIRALGPEPLTDAFDGAYLYRRSRGRTISIKPFIMNANLVVGVGNIYASEALFASGIHPRRPAGRVSEARYCALADAIKDVLERAIRAGGTTLRDFYGNDGAAGYFKQELAVYGREGMACVTCASPVRSIVLGQRSSFYCHHCQR
jgi:formamidopyrimidine-DNA glycosylase